MTVRGFVLRGVLAGAIGGLVAFVFARIVAEPVIQAAIDYEDGRDDAMNALAVAAGQAPADAGPDIFSRGVQANIGIGVGMIGLGIALGLFFAVAYALAHGRIAVRPRVLALLVAGAGLLTLYVTPFIKYPANPPSVGHEDTIGDRSGLYLIMVIGSLVFLAIAVVITQRLRERLGTWNAVLVAGLAYIVLSAVLMALLPSLGELSANVAAYGPAVTETPQPLRSPTGQIVYPGFDADLLYWFRLYSFTAQILLWGVLALVFGALVERQAGTVEQTVAEEPATV